MPHHPRNSRAPYGHNHYYYWYCVHVVHGRAIRDIARGVGVAPSTLSRQFRKIENLRDDAFFDAIIENLGGCDLLNNDVEDIVMKLENDSDIGLSDSQIAFEARRILRRLAERNTVLLAKKDLEVAGVFRQAKSGLQRLSVVSRNLVEEFVLRDWIELEGQNKVGRYTITARGRSALKRMLAAGENHSALAEAPSAFAAQHADYGVKNIAENGQARKFRVNFAENPINALARRRDKSGNPYLSPRQIGAGERIREDFEVAQIGPRVTQNWDRFLTGVTRGEFHYTGDTSPMAHEAHARWTKAMATLGTGLGDITFRVCCMLEGLETAERRLGWSARSGKIVLQIALDRLADFYNIRE